MECETLLTPRETVVTTTIALISDFNIWKTMCRIVTHLIKCDAYLNKFTSVIWRPCAPNIQRKRQNYIALFRYEVIVYCQPSYVGCFYHAIFPRTMYETPPWHVRLVIKLPGYERLQPGVISNLNRGPYAMCGKLKRIPRAFKLFSFRLFA